MAGDRDDAVGGPPGRDACEEKLPGVTTYVQCREQGEKLRARPELAAWSVRPSRVRHKNGRRDDAKI
jgi:hypothetical protein